MIDRIRINDSEDLTKEFYEYEKILEDSFEAGLPVVAPEYNIQEENLKWTLLKAVFFSSTVLTTIGEFHTVFHNNSVIRNI